MVRSSFLRPFSPLLRVALCLAFSLAGAAGVVAQAQVRLEYHAPGFWKALDRLAEARTDADSMRAIFEETIAGATPALRTFIVNRSTGSQLLLESVKQRPDWYQWQRSHAQVFDQAAREARDALARAAELIPDAKLPVVVLTVGRFNSMSALSDSMAHVALEWFAPAAGGPDDQLGDQLRRSIRPASAIAGHVVGTLVWANQSRAPAADTMLTRALTLGAQEFLAQLITGRPAEPALMEWARSREAELWRDFEQDRALKRSARWFAAATAETPANLARFVGHRIIEAYYRQAGERSAALREIITLRDPAAILAASRYHGS